MKLYEKIIGSLLLIAAISTAFFVFYQIGMFVAINFPIIETFFWMVSLGALSILSIMIICLFITGIIVWVRSK